MKNLLLLLALAAVAAFASAQYRCKAPDQLTFRGDSWNMGSQEEFRYYTQYDRINERIVTTSEKRVNGTVLTAHKVFFMHRDHIGFEYNIMLKNCSQFKIGAFKSIEVPATAVFEGEVVMGGPGEDVIIDRWSEAVKGKRETWIGEFSFRTCYPISQYVENDEKFNTKLLIAYYDVVLGITDPDSFVIPTACLKKPIAMQDISLNARIARSLVSRSLED